MLNLNKNYISQYWQCHFVFSKSLFQTRHLTRTICAAFSRSSNTCSAIPPYNSDITTNTRQNGGSHNTCARHRSHTLIMLIHRTEVTPQVSRANNAYTHERVTRLCTSLKNAQNTDYTLIIYFSLTLRWYYLDKTLILYRYFFSNTAYM